MSKDTIPMRMSGFCAHPSATENSHQWCRKPGCTCPCHDTKETDE